MLQAIYFTNLCLKSIFFLFSVQSTCSDCNNGPAHGIFVAIIYPCLLHPGSQDPCTPVYSGISMIHMHLHDERTLDQEQLSSYLNHGAIHCLCYEGCRQHGVNGLSPMRQPSCRGLEKCHCRQFTLTLLLFCVLISTICVTLLMVPACQMLCSIISSGDITGTAWLAYSYAKL